MPVVDCTCSDPDRADYHVTVLIVREVRGVSETASLDSYTCALDLHIDYATGLANYMVAAGWYVESFEIKPLGKEQPSG